MSNKNPSNKELINRVATEIEDPIFRKQLIEALMEREDFRNSDWKSQGHMAVHPEAVPSNVRLKKWVNAIGGIICCLLVYSHYRGTPDSATSHSFLWFMTFFMPLIFLINHIKLRNISRWQNSSKKPARSWLRRINPFG